MCSRVVPLRLSSEILEKIDKLVELGVFRSRSEALRKLIRVGLRNYERITRIAKAVELLFEMEKERGIPIRLDGALKQLLEERGSI
ncbi:ribbon-helix-helix domain-containing protein [Staphylothermus hellenicus]|uniref:Putative transcriptional regulator, CopG/Arc/MetJ family n=1 Tax=Staphylothermus hellenicus (strain DSM 12710 / JCM 10830 / BK20S6-10-b1 / P8) TaxID=591019 RepID=D7D870_STAHD|nr:ribbon-helix-helix domain-containing protein [Staphylothermus hellenicus]ADI31966.1 putative transcriptional regulator, CopG/Arc/MetJ family [Staphylothermus hellenicus DSM 12710]